MVKKAIRVLIKMESKEVPGLVGLCVVSCGTVIRDPKAFDYTALAIAKSKLTEGVAWRVISVEERDEIHLYSGKELITTPLTWEQEMTAFQSKSGVILFYASKACKGKYYDKWIAACSPQLMPIVVCPLGFCFCASAITSISWGYKDGMIHGIKIKYEKPKEESSNKKARVE